MYSISPATAIRNFLEGRPNKVCLPSGKNYNISDLFREIIMWAVVRTSVIGVEIRGRQHNRLHFSDLGSYYQQFGFPRMPVPDEERVFELLRDYLNHFFSHRTLLEELRCDHGLDIVFLAGRQARVESKGGMVTLIIPLSDDIAFASPPVAAFQAPVTLRPAIGSTDLPPYSACAPQAPANSAGYRQLRCGHYLHESYFMRYPSVNICPNCGKPF